MYKMLTFALAVSVSGFAVAQSQAPTPSTLNLSLKTMSKALAGCRVSYIRVQTGTSSPLVEAILGEADYQKDMTSLKHAETFLNMMTSHPESVTGKALVATLSSSDDFFAGVAATRLAILSSLISAKQKPNPPAPDELFVASTSLADCQTALFNAGDDFVDLVMNYVGAEDDALAAMAAKAQRKKERQ